jgi:hypothetical protein
LHGDGKPVHKRIGVGRRDVQCGNGKQDIIFGSASTPDAGDELRVIDKWVTVTL